MRPFLLGGKRASPHAAAGITNDLSHLRQDDTLSHSSKLLPPDEKGIGLPLRREREFGMFPILSGGIGSVRERPALESQIETMRRDVQVRGECIVPYDALRALCEDASPPRNQWEEIAKIAIDEGWGFTFFPDRSARFAMLSS